MQVHLYYDHWTVYKTFFWKKNGISNKNALLDFNLAPLNTRRDIAMLGLLFKISSGTAPASIIGLFRPWSSETLGRYGFCPEFRVHSKALHDPVEAGHPLMIKRSIFGLIRTYNVLPDDIINANTPQIFQKRLQNRAKIAADNDMANWDQMFSIGQSRIPFFPH